MPFSLDKIKSDIALFYPTLEVRFSQAFPSFSFSQVEQQLCYAFNQIEIERGLHRLHCLLREIENPTIDIFKTLSDTQKEALVALAVIDACKGTADLTKQFSGSLPADSVEWFFASLQKCPEIHPVFAAISQGAQDIVCSKLFYLHERHAFYGEVPMDVFEPLVNQSLDALQMLHAFWMLNFLGFRAPMKEWGADSSREVHGPAVSAELIARFASMQAVLDNVVRQQNLKPLADFYHAGLPESVTQSFIFLSRLSMLLSGDQRTAAAHVQCIDEIIEKFNLIKKAAKAEADCYKALHLRAFTFLPAVFWKLFDLNKDKSLTEVVSIYLRLQTALYKGLSAVNPVELQGNRAISLSVMSGDATFLTEYSRAPSEQIELQMTIGTFVGVTATMPKPVLNPQNFAYAGRASGSALHSPFDFGYPSPK